MDAFGIEFTSVAPGSVSATGLIQLGDDRDYFESTLGFWTVEQYERSWLDSLRHLVAGAPTSCLVTSITDPNDSVFVVTWPLYRDRDRVYVQNHLVFLD